MKKLLVLASLAALVYACGNNAAENQKSTENPTDGVQSENSSTPPPAGAADLSSNPVYQKGLSLIAGSDCLTCHKVEEKLIGPAYRDIAAKYENNEANLKYLSEKIIKGGSGVWGEIPMAAHENISQADAEAMVQYIFLLKK
jgi:cytochrome c